MAIWDKPGELPRGWMKPAYKYIKDKLGDNLVGAAIGISFGYGEEYVLDTMSLKKFYMIDPYRHFDFSALTPELWEEQYQYAKNKFSSLPNVEFWRISSEEAAPRVADGSLDFVYIDGNHFYPAVKQDIDLWWPKVKSGGVIGGHDYNPCTRQLRKEDLETFRIDYIHYGVVKAVNDFAEKNNLKINSAVSNCAEVFDWWIDK